MVNSRAQAVRLAKGSTRNTPGTCQLWTRTMFNSPSVGDVDRDGDSDAVDGWKSEPFSARHTDLKPPAGTPVAWGGGRKGFGHRAISLGPVGPKGVYMIRSTDAGGSGVVATVRLSYPVTAWGLTYLGWSETIGGVTIPGGPKESATRGSQVDEAIKQLRGEMAGKNFKPWSLRGLRIRRAHWQLQKISPLP